MTFDSNFLIIIIILILILVLLYLNSLANEKFQDKLKCADIKSISIDSEYNNSNFCPSYCKASLTKDGNMVYCVDNR